MLPEAFDGERDSSDDSTPRTEGSGLYDEERDPSAESIIREGQPEPYDTRREVQILVVTQYEEIREEISRLSEELEKRTEAGKRRVSLQPVRNTHAAEGISASIRLGTEKAMDAGSDAVVFFAADMPTLPPAEIRLFLKQFLASGKSFACMESMPGYIPTNPGAFRLTKDNCGKLMKLALKKYGEQNFKREILCFCDSPE